ncbi:uncharacterized protein F5147DRAFT_557522, partial [Suillus discolor]
DSIYFMVRRLRYLQQPIDYFLEHPNNKELRRHKLSTTEWLVLRDCKVMLMVPHIALQSMSSERLPVLCGTIIIFKQFIAKWKSLQNSQPRL